MRSAGNTAPTPARRTRGKAKRTSGLSAELQKLKAGTGGMDFQFLITVYILIAFGLLMVLSASSPTAYAHEVSNHDSLFYFKNQFMWMLVGTAGLVFAANFDYKRIGKLSPLIVTVALVLLVLVLIPGVGTTRNNATRWLFGFQPSEIAKFAVIVFFSYSLSKNYQKLQFFWKGFIPYLLVLGVFAVLLMLEPHFSCTMLIAFTAFLLLFVAGAKIRHFVIVGLPAVPAIIALVILEPYRLARVLSFLDPFADIQGDGWQVVQSLYAIGSGGLFGLGLGKSRQKFLNIPEPHNDFIFSILAEELGFIGAVLVVVLFMILIIRGIRIASQAPDLFGTLMATGIIGLIAIQVILNIAVVTSSMPVTGMPLPFFSYGGTALAINMTEMGIMLNISRQSKKL